MREKKRMTGSALKICQQHKMISKKNCPLLWQELCLKMFALSVLFCAFFKGNQSYSVID